MLKSVWSVLLGLSCLIFTQAVATELPSPPHSDAALIGLQNVLSTGLSNVGTIPKKYIEQEKTFNLTDGTQIPTLLFQSPSSGPRPLIIANFGLFSDERGNMITGVIDSLVLTGKINADFLVVDNVTSATFFAANDELGFGGYDEGRILVELAHTLRTSPDFKNSSIELLGISLGGNAVLQALVEEHRLGRKDFDSAVIFSSVIDELESSSQLLRTFGHPLPELPADTLGLSGRLIVDFALRNFNSQIKDFKLPEIPREEIGDFYFSKFQSRLERFKKSTLVNWNPEVSRDSVASYIMTSSALLKKINEVETPLIVIHSKDDPLVSFSQFKKFANEQKDNPRIFTHSTHFGGHWGFMGIYGHDWILEYISRARTILAK